MECHLQIHLNHAWRDCAVVSISAGSARSVFEYDLDYAFGSVLEPVALRFPVNAERHQRAQWPAFLYDLVPQGKGRNYLLGQLGLADGPGADFALIQAGAFNPVGRVRVAEAVEYFQQHVSQHHQQELANGLRLEEILARGEAFHERMLVHSMLAAGTTGVQGAAPKYLLTQDHDGLWHADGILPDERAAAHFIVKRPRGNTAADKKVLKNEAAYMRVAAAVGIRTYGRLEYHADALFIPRFDRAVTKAGVHRLHQESAASLAGLTGFNDRPSQFTLLQALREVVTDKTGETIEFLKRDVLNLAMRNTDNHARNTAVQKVGAEVRLTPLFDFAPMYLDPEGIPRTARWYHPVSKHELTEWTDIISVLPLPDTEREHIIQEMAAFGGKLQALEQHMRAAAVDEDIVLHLGHSVGAQIQKLAALGAMP